MRKGDPNFIEEWTLLRRPPRDNKARMYQAMLRKMIIMNRLYANKRTRGVIPKVKNGTSFRDLLKQLDNWMPENVKVGKKAPKKGKNGYKDFVDIIDQVNIDK